MINHKKSNLSEITEPYIHQGRILNMLSSSACASLNDYKNKGGIEILRKTALESKRNKYIKMLELAKLRGRAGAGYPTAHKWKCVYSSKEKEKYFICNANAGADGSFKEKYLLNLNPHKIIEAIATAACVIGANKAIIALPPQFHQESSILEQIIAEMREFSYLGNNIFGTNLSLEIIVFQTLGSYIIGEETALLELLEGKLGRPRTKPPLPTNSGLFGKPTVVNNLETVLHTQYIFQHGSNNFRKQGTAFSTGTQLFCLSGHIKRPGIYELPFGTSIKELIDDYGQGVNNDLPIKAVFPGGISSNVLGKDDLDIKLDYDSIIDAGSSLGSGSVIVLNESVSITKLAAKISSFFNNASCGKCQPCKDGTGRTTIMLENLNRLSEKSIDRLEKVIPSSKRIRTLNVIQPIGGISYTDNFKGLDKIIQLCEFYKYRGDCNHSKESASTIQSIIHKFKDEFQEKADSVGL
jgi:NADH-quinone oxidoreductase subunit F